MTGRGGVQRDENGNALLIPAGGSTLRMPYSSASGLFDVIPTDVRGLMIWSERYLARGLGLRPDLALLAAVETYNTGLDMIDVAGNKASGWRLDQLIQRAKDAVRIEEKADYGTAIHAATEPGNELPQQILQQYRMAGDIGSWQAFLAGSGIEIVDTEVFVANDHVLSAGTFDHLVRVPGLAELVILDKKVGKVKVSATACQTSIYANAEVYDPETDQRMSFEEKYGAPVSKDYSILANIAARQARTDAYVLDIRAGWKDAYLAAMLRDRRAQLLEERELPKPHWSFEGERPAEDLFA